MREPVPDSDTTVARPFAWIWRAVSPLLVLFVLAGVGVWGSRTGWRFVGASAEPLAPPEAEGPRRVFSPPPVSWCADHGVHVCPLCQPDAAELAKPPVIGEADRTRVAKALSVRPRAENRRNSHWHEYRIEFPTAGAADRFGVDIAVAWQSAMTEAITAPGEITYVPSRVAKPGARAAGTVARVFHKVGDPVKTGDLLALVDSAEVGKGKTEFLQAVAQLRHKTRALESLKSATGLLPAERREVEAALREAEVRSLAAEQALAYFGLGVKADDYRRLPAADAARALKRIGWPAGFDAASANLLPVTAPIDGELISGDVVAGEVVDPMKPLFVIAGHLTHFG